MGFQRHSGVRGGIGYGDHAGGSLQRSPGKQTLTERLPVQRQISKHGATGEHSIPAAVLRPMEASLGADLGDVRVHEGPRAAELGAEAFTQGNEVHFAPGRYDPSSRAGQELLGHELAHVVQQREGRVQATTQGKGLAVNEDPELEREADDKGIQAAIAAGGEGPSGTLVGGADAGSGGASGKSSDLIALIRAMLIELGTGDRQAEGSHEADETIAADGGETESAQATESPGPPAQAMIALGPPIQFGKPNKKKEKELKQQIEGLMSSNISTSLYSKLNNLLERLDEAMSKELGEIKHELSTLLSTHKSLAQPMKSSKALRKFVDMNNTLLPQVDVRKSFYSSSYDSTAQLAKQTWMNNHQGATGGTVHCPHCNTDVPSTDITIDHVVSVASHWNSGSGVHPAGRRTDQMRRKAFYNDVTNHRYMCRPCNSSINSGGVFYNRKVMPGFLPW